VQVNDFPDTLVPSQHECATLTGRPRPQLERHKDHAVELLNKQFLGCDWRSRACRARRVAVKHGLERLLNGRPSFNSPSRGCCRWWKEDRRVIREIWHEDSEVTIPKCREKAINHATNVIRLRASGRHTKHDKNKRQASHHSSP
jgi:hypothetical protein